MTQSQWGEMTKVDSNKYNERSHMPPKKKKKFNPIAYITSYARKGWLYSQVRKDALAIANNACEVCGATKKDGAKLEVHHREPVILYNEVKKLCEKLLPPVELLDVLCHDCHQKEHKP